MSSLQTRLTLSYTLVILVALGAAGLSLYGLTIRDTIRVSGNALLDQAVEVARFVRQSSAESAPAEAPQGADLRRTVFLLQLAGRLTDAQVILASRDGSILSSTRVPARPLTRPLARLVADAVAARRPVVRQVADAEDHPVLVAVAPLAGVLPDLPVAAGYENLAVVLTRPLAGVRLAGLRLVRPLLLAGLLALAVALALGVGLARSVSGPVRRLAEGARRLAAGDFTARAGKGPPGDLGKLAEAFDHMAGRLGELVAALAGEKQLLADMVTGLGHGLVAVDDAGAVIHLNPRAEEYLGIPTASGTGRPLAALSEELAGLVARAAAERRPVTGEMAGPGERTLLVVATPMGREGAVAVLQDVTAARQLDRMRRDFIASVSHELRTPVTAIQGFLGAIREGVARDPGQHDRYLAIIEEETARLRRLIDDLFEYAKMESGQVSFRFEPLDLVPALRRAVGSMAALAARDGIVLAAELPPTLGPVLADRDRIIQVATNLLGNALRFTGEGGKITLRAWQEEDACCVEISDTGAGIPPEELDRIFDRFHKGPDQGARRAGGAGLGLAIARHLVEVHGGRIGARSRPGEGATFTFSLPLPEAP